MNAGACCSVCTTCSRLVNNARYHSIPKRDSQLPLAHSQARRCPLMTERQRDRMTLNSLLALLHDSLPMLFTYRCRTCLLDCCSRCPARCQEAEDCDKERVHDAAPTLYAAS